MAIVPNGNAPYAPVKSVLDVIGVHRERGTRPITNELLLRLDVPEGNVGRTIQALRLLDLIDDAGEPLPALTELQRAMGEDEYRARFEQVVRAAYDDVFQVIDPASATEAAIDGAFRLYRPGSQRGRMVTLFLGLCEEAGIITKGPRKRGRAEQRAPRARVGTPAQRHTPPPPPPPPPPAAEARDLRHVDDAVLAVVRRIPASGSWSQRERDKLIRAFEASLDLTVEIVESEPGGAPE